MIAAPIEKYKFKSSTPTEELMVMCRLLSEVGIYASTLHGEYLRFADKCKSVQTKIEQELNKRQAVHSIDDIYKESEETVDTSDLSALSISQLYVLYRQSKRRFEARLSDGLEAFTRFFETRIVKELKCRKTLTAIEQLKRDYCIMTNKNELKNISRLIQLPVGVCNLDPKCCEKQETLLSMIKRLEKFESVAEREKLIESVDYALAYMEEGRDKQQFASLAAELAWLRYRKIVRCPELVNKFLMDAIKQWQKNPTVPDTEMVMPLLTASHIYHDDALMRKAQRIINSCYRNCILVDTSLNEACFINSIHIATTCCDYVTRFNSRKIAVAWDRYVASIAIGSLSTLQITKLLETAKEIEEFAPISNIGKEELANTINERISMGDFSAEIYFYALSKEHNIISKAV